MVSMGVRLLGLLAAAASCVATMHTAPVHSSHAATASNYNGANCPQSLVDGDTPPKTTFWIGPKVPITPFFQAHCGETSVMQAASNLAGTWMSQFNARLLCGATLNFSNKGGATVAKVLQHKVHNKNMHHSTSSETTTTTTTTTNAATRLESTCTVGMPLNQSGPPGFCETYKVFDFNAQASYNIPGAANVGPLDFASGPTCLANAHVDAVPFPSATQASGVGGYSAFISWIKARLIAGNVVSIGVLEYQQGSVGDNQYDHEVTVLGMGTNHSPTDSKYYSTDVLYIEDHGAWAVNLTTVSNGKADLLSDYHEIPPGANESLSCTPFVYGYKVSKLAATRAQADKNGLGGAEGLLFHLALPGTPFAGTGFGQQGLTTDTDVSTRSPAGKTRNFGWAASAPHDPTRVLLPVSVSVVNSSTHGLQNPKDPVCGYNYENPLIGGLGSDQCTNVQPAAMVITLNATVGNLTVGTHYNLYQFTFKAVTGAGPAVRLAMPDLSFNANKAIANNSYPFTATASTHSQLVANVSSMSVVVFRAVAASAT